jgi:hypothetical protein
MDAPSSSTQLQKVHVATASKSTGSGVYASATGLPSSYEQVHGAPSREPVTWASVRAVAKEELTEVLYDKGEQIARVIFLLQALCALDCHAVGCLFRLGRFGSRSFGAQATQSHSPYFGHLNTCQHL